MKHYASFTQWFSGWTVLPGVPAPGWETEHRQGQVFHLDACINLDTFYSRPAVPGKEELTLYADFATKDEGLIFFGMGCNGLVEIYCDGQLKFSTFESGNGANYIFPSNHRVEFEVGEGRHLLAFRVRRGMEPGWDFACGWVNREVPPEPSLVTGPWLTNPDCGKISVAFTCNIPLGAAIRYRKVGDTAWQYVWHHRQGQCLRRTYHAIRLDNLTPGAKYEYNVVVIHPDKYTEVQLGDSHTFTTFDDSSPKHSFFFTADLQFPLDTQKKYLANMLNAADAATCDFFVLDGDVNSAFSPESVIDGPFRQLCDYNAAEKPVIYVRGNHEMRGTEGDRFLDFFAQNNGTTYDVIRLGDTAFLLLDSWEDKPAKTPGHTYCQWNMDDWFIKTETEWLKSAMTDEKWTSAKRRILICHGAAYSHYDSCKCMPYTLQKMTDPFFEGLKPQSPLNLWLAGHVHRYLRSIPGTDRIAAEQQPPYQAKDGKNYIFPVLTVGGPCSGLEIQASCFRIDADEEGFTIHSWDQNGNLIEHLRYDNNGTLTEFKALPQFTVPIPKHP